MIKNIFLVLGMLFLFSCQGNTQSKSKIELKEIDHSRNPYYSNTDTNKLNLTNEQWKKILSDDLYQVARNKDTERPFTGKYWDYEGLGNYYCAACGNALFKSDGKFSSSCGWPSFFEPIRKNAAIYETDNSLNMERIEVLCGRCGGHLGHLFDDGPPPTGMRYCMNSIMLDFVPDKKGGKNK